MEHLHVNVRRILSLFFLLSVSKCTLVRNEAYTVQSSTLNIPRSDIVTLDIQRRDVSPSPAPTVTETTPIVNSTEAKNTSVTEKPVPVASTVSVTQIPLLGANGTGILKIDLPKNTPKVSDPITPDDSLPLDIFMETPERIKADHNVTNLKYDNHIYYNSSFIGNVTYFDEYWNNITTLKATVHPKLSNSHRRATTVNLTFPFPYYGHEIYNVTVASGGFVYTGEHTHNWLAATQYIAPLMGNFDTSLTNDSYVKLCDDGEKFTAFWENVTLQGNVTKKFTFAVTLYRNGDIVFAYKDIPIDVQAINDTEHPVKVGISDAYISEDNVFNVRSKKIFEYHRISLKNHEITNNTILRLTALPTCLQYKSCESCLTHNTGFNCTWCPDVRVLKCSSGTDRFKQDWVIKQCYKRKIATVEACSAAKPSVDGTQNSTQNSDTNIYKTDIDEKKEAITPQIGKETAVRASAVNEPQRQQAEHSGIGGAVAAFVIVALVCCVSAWVLYAFKNPHTPSGQFLIKYRPSRWNWRRGEARYTAATIHM